MFHITQWTRSAPSISRLSMIRARLTVPSGRPSQPSGGEMFGTLAEIWVQVCFLGMRLFSWNTGLVKTMLASTCWETACPASAGAAPSPPEAWAEAAAGAPAAESPSSSVEHPAAKRATSRAVAIRAVNSRPFMADLPSSTPVYIVFRLCSPAADLAVGRLPGS